MAMRTLESERLRATISDDGAELISVIDKSTGAERIWTGDPAVWNRHAPILFPFVGKVVDGKYRIGNREYPMKTQHGFARDAAFECVEAGAGAVIHRLAASERTLAIYPYDFALTVRHFIAPQRPGELVVEWTVENPGHEEMLFSIGGHPGFLMPEGVRKEDCDLLFPGMDALTMINTSAAGYALPQRKALALTDGRVHYRADIPETWIFEDNQVKEVGIALPDGRPLVMLRCEQFPMLAVWANPKGPFICLEPWFGRTDDEGFAGTLDQKKGVQRLAAGGRRTISYSMAFC